jgi:threonine dehydrogenase-like Zn-dependent dehydrogenase
VETAVDCSGSGGGGRLCLEAAREWGRVAFVGEGGTVTFEPSPLLLHKQLTLHGSWVCGLVEMQTLLEWLAREGLHPETTVTHRFRLEEAEEAYRLFDTGKTGKVVLTWPE